VTDPTGTIIAVATSLPIDFSRQNPTGSGCHQHPPAGQQALGGTLRDLVGERR
jgi:hypothetical protein